MTERMSGNTADIAPAPAGLPGRLDRQRLLGRPDRLSIGAFAAALILLAGDRVGLDRWSPLVQLTAFRPHLLLILTVAGLVAAIARRPWFGAALLVPCLLAATALVPRLVGEEPNPRAGGRQLRVLSANVVDGGVTRAELLRLIRGRQPDAIILLEAGQWWTATVDPALRELGYTGANVETAAGPVGGTAVYLHRHLGPAEITPLPGTTFGALQARAPGLGSLRLVGMHPHPPFPGGLRPWRADLRAVQRWCDGSTIVAGDLNATLDHSRLRAALGRCADAAERAGTGLTGTWPSSRPRWAGIQIDHVLVPPAVGVDRVDVLDLAGSDHRAVLATLRLG